MFWYIELKSVHSINVQLPETQRLCCCSTAHHFCGQHHEKSCPPLFFWSFYVFLHQKSSGRAIHRVFSQLASEKSLSPWDNKSDLNNDPYLMRNATPNSVLKLTPSFQYLWGWKTSKKWLWVLCLSACVEIWKCWSYDQWCPGNQVESLNVGNEVQLVQKLADIGIFMVKPKYQASNTFLCHRGLITTY